jgi:serine/threonine protein phosphatase PrpC
MSDGDDLDAIARKLIETANEHGGEDNCTVVLLSVEE